MPMTYGLQGSGVVVAIEAGRITLDDCRKYCRAVAEDAALPRPLRLLIDKRQVLDSSHDYLTVVAFADEFSLLFRSAPANRIAFLATADIIYGQLRQLQILLESRGLPIEVFRDCGQARAWFGLPEDE
jgi:hypothetical protein